MTTTMTVNAEQFQMMLSYVDENLWKEFDQATYLPSCVAEKARKMGRVEVADKMQSDLDAERENDRQKQLDFNQGISQGATFSDIFLNTYKKVTNQYAVDNGIEPPFKETVDALGERRVGV